jgi:hypothetical protein
MSWSASTGPTHRYNLWNTIDRLAPEQPGLPEEKQDEFGHQLHNAKAAAKAICNAFNIGEYPILNVSISGHVYTGHGDSPNFINVSVGSPDVPVSAQPEPQPESQPEPEPIREPIEVTVLEPTEREGE